MFKRTARNPTNIILTMATTTLRFRISRTEIPGVFALMEAEDTPACEQRNKKPNVGVREIEIITDEANAGYFRTALGGVTNG